jgi:hypothetical protein
MRRREFIGLVGAAAVVGPRTAVGDTGGGSTEQLLSK